VAKYDYVAQGTQELSLRKNEKLLLLDDSKHWWKVGPISATVIIHSQDVMCYIVFNFLGPDVANSKGETNLVNRQENWVDACSSQVHISHCAGVAAPLPSLSLLGVFA